MNASKQEIALAEQIVASGDSDEVVDTVLLTDQKVLARVTDGIYRQPGSALRELISNAYDADATSVVIKTDRPRFERITVEDNGHGMSPETLAHLIHHIGGSAKRNAIGADLGVTAVGDPFRSPMGRRLIGKIGIGLFSVAQLTHEFQILTKVKGDNYRTVATVVLKQYSEDSAISTENEEFEAGKVRIWREKASDVESHGTSIVLTAIRPQARDTLRSRDIWNGIEEAEKSPEKDEHAALTPPRFNIGRVDAQGRMLLRNDGELDGLPWQDASDPAKAFESLVQAVWNETEKTPNPKLEYIFDYYLRMVWQLALSVPLPYVNGHVFDLDLSATADAFLLPNRGSGAAEPVPLTAGETLRSKLDLVEPAAPPGEFNVYFDDLKLSRPIRYQGLPLTAHALKRQLIFVGKCREEFARFPRELSGGPLDFEAYLMWTPKVAPTEHRGSLIRIHGASGTLFDPTFMRYQVSEQNRLAQITCEIFVHEGLDSALNIDRESFNFAHPHSVYLTKWLHAALRHLASTQKRLANSIRIQKRATSESVFVTEVQDIVTETWNKAADDPGSAPPTVELVDEGIADIAARADEYVFRRSAIIPKREGKSSAQDKSQGRALEVKLRAIAQVLATFDLLDNLSKAEQERLLSAIYRVLEATEEK